MNQQRMRHKVTNWREYNKSLIARGSINLWISDDIADRWYSSEISGRRGRRQLYSDFAIETILTFRSMFNLPLRSAQGFVKSLLIAMELDLDVPDYSRLSRRAKTLKINLKRLPNKSNIDVAIDSTGVKIYGEGEWKVRQHGVGKRRTWKKLHLVVDPLDSEIVGWDLTSNDVSDDKAFTDVIQQVDEEIGYCFGDGAYDKKDCYDGCYERDITLIVPPRKDAVLQEEARGDPAKIPRDRTIERINQLQEKLGDKDEAIKQWKYEADYHARSLAETAMFRFKTLCGDKLRARKFATQKTEIAIKINILNQFMQLGMPITTIAA